MKRLLALCAAMLFSVSAFAAALPKAQEDFYANDFSAVLSGETVTHIVNTAATIAQECDAQIVVTTIPTTDGEDIAAYALKMGREWGIGGADENNGVLILIATDDHQSRIEVGRGLEGALPDGKTGRIQDDYMIPHFKDNDYDGGIRAGFDAVVIEVCNEYGIEVPDGVTRPEGDEDDDFDMGTVIGIIVIVIVFLIIGSRGGRGGVASNTWRGGVSGGGFLGGGRSSGGSSGGGFSGGGGGFSGGGSSRGW